MWNYICVIRCDVFARWYCCLFWRVGCISKGAMFSKLVSGDEPRTERHTNLHCLENWCLHHAGLARVFTVQQNERRSLPCIHCVVTCEGFPPNCKAITRRTAPVLLCADGCMCPVFAYTAGAAAPKAASLREREGKQKPRCLTVEWPGWSFTPWDRCLSPGKVRVFNPL